MNRIEQAREALIWYENNVAGSRLPHSGGDAHRNALAADGGKRAADTLAALSTPVDGEGAEPRVKPLEWEDSGSVPDGPWSETRLKQARGHHNLGRYAGSYTVQEMEPDGKWGWWCTWTSDRFPEGVEDTKEEAKAAAQADYERRILSALTTPETEARLRERVAELERELATIRAILASTDVSALPDDYPTARMAEDRIRMLNERTMEGLALIGRVEAAETRLAQSNPAPAAGGQQEAVAWCVKPLEWRGSEGIWFKADAEFGGRYRIAKYSGMQKPFKLETHGWWSGLPCGHYELLDEAKAAAQADYEARILSALQPQPVKGEDRQP